MADQTRTTQTTGQLATRTAFPVAEADPLVRVIRDRLPERLRVQLRTATLRARAEALAGAGWTEPALAGTMAGRVWTGAHGGAVITWLADLASQGPPQAATANDDSRAMTLRLRAEAVRTKSAAAGPDSPARVQARQLVAQLGRRPRR